MTDETTPPPRRMSAARKTVLLGAATALAVILGGVAATTFVNDEPAAPPVEAYQPDGTRLGPVSGTEDTPLPDTPLPAFHEEGDVRLSEYRGEPLVVNFWATWCPPCVAEMPDFQEVSDDLRGEVAFVGVNAQDNHEQAQRFVAELGITYDLVRDPRADYFREVRGFGWPTTLLVDEGGIIRYRHTGPLDAEQLRDLLATHLGVEA
jgi:cytochrome c biogenesis protein CcmG, thiol:disulfide interchange protein DsbE